MNKRWMIYGANGYTGKLTAEEAGRRGLSPILAGRRREAIEPLARRLGLDFRLFGLGDPGSLALFDVNGDGVINPLDVGFIASRLGDCDP